MELRCAASDLVERLTKAGYEAFFAGGCVRDKILGIEPVDYDIATSATPAEVLELFPTANQVGAHFGVVIVKHHKHTIEVATFRTDGSYGDGRRPDSVEFSSAIEDAQRRDFTINGLFENPHSGEIIDYINGVQDLEAKWIRAIGSPMKRFEEDGLRLLRAIRFSVRLNFTIEVETLNAMALNTTALQKISPERIRDEFSKIICSPHRRKGLELLVSTNLIRYIIPEVLSLIGCEQPPQWHPEGDVYTHTCIMLEMLREDAPLELCLATLLHDIGKPATYRVDADGRIRFNGHDVVGEQMSHEILERLKYSNSIIRDVAFMVSRHMQFMNVQKMREAKLKRFMSETIFWMEMELHRVDCASSNGFTDNYIFLQSKQQEFSHQPLIPAALITGKDLIAMGLVPSSLFKKILNEVEIEQLEDRIHTREDALAFTRALLDKKSI